ncbi:hypothetical protein [Aureibacillus halotolerans]|uniref:hypothetical protein n=1 Tax=Aureibacillus halotolerans TaxID=1508390 RepID=UPI00105FD0AB|nr:hypothetical protein [Aureibacillus halotolerans]
MKHVLALLTGLFFVLMTFNLSHAEEPEVTVEEATKVIEAEIESFQPDFEFYGLWDDAIIEHETDLYDITDNIIAYYFLLKVKGEDVGYYIISADKDYSPVLEFGGTPGKSGFDEQNSDDRVYYFGGQKYLMAEDAEEIKHKIKVLQQKNSSSSRETKNIDADNINQAIKSLSLNKDPNAKSQWENYLNAGDFGIQSLPEKYALNIPYIYQRTPGINGPESACGPTALAMAVEYLSDIGLDVRDASYWGGDVKLVNALRNFLGTDGWGTTSGNMSYFTTKYLNIEMNGWTVSSKNANSSGAINIYKDRVVSSRPPLVMWDIPKLIPWPDAEVRWHWNTGSAYRESNGQFQFGVKDPEFNSSRTVYYSWSANDAGFHIIHYTN